jgi:hypothetical protein
MFTISLLVLATTCLATVCELPESDGTVYWPPACPEGYLGEMNIIDGLPPESVAGQEDGHHQMTEETGRSLRTVRDAKRRGR